MSERVADLRVYDEASAPVLRWLSDLDDLLGAVAVAGLAWPDADLGADLRALAERGRGLGADSGAERLVGLAGGVDAIRAAESSSERAEREKEAFRLLMAVVGWERRARVELDRIGIQASLVVRGTSEGGERRRRGPVSSARLEPVGIELSGDRLAIHAVDRDTGAPALLMDRLQEVDDADPLGRPAISRLFQGRTALGEALGGALQLEEHPVAIRGGVVVVRPAFDAAVRVLRIEGARKGAPERVGEDWPESPVRVRARLGREGERIRLEVDGEALPVAETAVLRYALTKLAIREGGLSEVDVTVRMRKAVPALLGVDHPHDGRVFPVVDPRAFALSARRLAERAGSSIWYRAVLARELGPDPQLERAIAEGAPDGIDAAWRLGRAARALGLAVPAVCIGWAAPTFADPDATGEGIWRAIWLLLAGDRVEDHVPALQRVWADRYATAPKEPTPWDLCARAVLMDLLEVGATEEQSAAERAVGYLDAHLAALRLSARSREPRLPALDALASLAETRLMLTGDGGAAPLVVLDLPPDRLRLEGIEAIWHAWTTGTELERAGDAVWALGLAGMKAQLFG